MMESAANKLRINQAKMYCKAFGDFNRRINLLKLFLVANRARLPKFLLEFINRFT